MTGAKVGDMGIVIEYLAYSSFPALPPCLHWHTLPAGIMLVCRHLMHILSARTMN